MNNQLKISDFVKLTGSTLKTVLYYHKVGLLPEPERSPGGYRLYGAAELTRMQWIKHLKSLGMDLKRIKEVLGDQDNERYHGQWADHGADQGTDQCSVQSLDQPAGQKSGQGHDKTLREVLESLRKDLIREKKSLEERIAQIDLVLNEDKAILNEGIGGSSSFQMITGILRPEQVENYARTNPELLAQQRKVFGILDDFQWGEEYRDTFKALAEYFQAHPEEYQRALDLGVRLSSLSQLVEDDPEIEVLAREATDFIKGIPELKALLSNRPGMKEPQAGVYHDLVAEFHAPARLKHMELFQKYLRSEEREQ